MDLVAFHWSEHFQHVNRALIPRDMFPDVFDDEARVGEEAADSILRSRSDVSASVTAWLATDGVEENLVRILDKENDPKFSLSFTSQDFGALLDTCNDAYLVSNPEVSDGWKDVLAGFEKGFKGSYPDYVKVVERTPTIPDRRRLSNMFDKYANATEIGESARSDFGLGVRRFIQLHGDIDVQQVDRRHVEDFRDLLRKMPSRPPNDIRKLPMTDQVFWAEGKDTKRFSQATINKNIGGVKVTLQYAFDETSEIGNRDWRNPCDGFSKKPKVTTQNRIRAFKPDEVSQIFSAEVFKTKTVENFWIPLVLFFTGARLDEISQLHVGDLRMEPVPHIVCENLDDEDPARAKKVKSLSSNRTIPIHGRLIDIGFLSYVNAVRDAGHTHIFPNLPHHRGRKRGDKVSRAFMRNYRDFGKAHPETGLNTDRLVTHSLRHTFRTAGYRGKLGQEFVQVVMGHFIGGVSFEVYGSEIYHMPDVLAERVMDEIKLPPVDREFLITEATRHLASVT